MLVPNTSVKFKYANIFTFLAFILDKSIKNEACFCLYYFFVFYERI